MAKVKPIRIYEYNTTSFNNNGLGVLFPSDAVIERNLSEMTYSLNITHPLDEYGKWELLQEDRIIKANEQLFRIKYVTKTLTSIEAYCEHIFFDLQNNFIEDTNIVNKNGNIALNQILDAMVYDYPFPVTATSDLAIVNNSRLVRKNVLTAIIGGDDNSFINRWGGELDIDGFTFCINSRIGQNRGYKISYGKNLTGLDAQFDMTNVCTVIRPIGFDGIELPDDDKYVYSQYVDNYAMPIIREYKYEDVKWVGSPNYKEPSDGTSDAYQTLEEAQSELRRRAEIEFTENKIDIPSATYNINFIELSQTEEYKDYQALAQINIGDDVTITHKRLGIDIPARCISYKYNCLTANFDEITLGYYNRNFFSKTMDVINESEFIQTLPDKLNDFLQQAKDQATEILMGGFGGHVYVTPNAIYIMDTEDINTAQKIWVWNVNGLGYSSTGINGTFGTAITMDGQIVADFINTGILNAQLVKSGILESLNGKSWINMETGDFNLSDKVSYENGVFQISVSSSDISTSDGSSLNDKLDSIDNAINDITDSPTVEISGEQVFIEKNNVITPSSIILNAIVKNTTDAGKWQYYDNTNWVDLGQTDISLIVTPTMGLLSTSNSMRIRYIVGTIYDEMTIVKLIDGKNGQTTYLHIKYSDDGGKTFTSNNGETLGSWIGTYTDFTEADSSDVSYYLWKKFVGENGKDGTSVSIKGSYTQDEWNNTWQSLVHNATNGDGYLVDGNLYVFDGVTFTNCGSIKGETGEAGKSSYLHIKYSNDGGKTFTNNDGETVGDWMGTYVDNESSDSTNVSRYTWKKIVGEDGIDGKDGENAQMVIITGEQAFKYTNNFTGIPTPETIVLTANKINTTANGTWQYMDENGVWKNYTQDGVLQTGSTINISYNSKIFGTTDAKTMRLRYFISDIVSDEITLIKISDGAKGNDGSDAYTIILTNENDTFNADQSGNITSAITTTTNVIAYKGSMPITPTIGTLPTVNGLTLSKSGTTITIQANTGTSLATNGKIDIPITVDGKSFTKVFSWSKVNKGTNAYSASIGSSSQVFKSIDGGKTFAPDTITLTPILQDLSYSKWQYSTDGGSTWTDVSSGSHGLTLTNSDVVTITYGEIVLNKTSSSITKGSTDTFTVKLNKKPTNNQTIRLSVNNSNASIDKTSLKFTPSNYNTAQTVTITGSTVGTSTITLSSPNVSNKTVAVTVTDSSSGGSTLTIETASQGFNPNGTLDGNNAFTHTETYIPFSGNTDATIQFGKSGWTRHIFYDSNKTRIGYTESKSAITSITMTELQASYPNAVYVRVSINQTTTIALTGTSTASVSTLSLDEDEFDSNSISVYSDDNTMAKNLIINESSDLFTTSTTSIVFKLVTDNPSYYDTMTIVKLSDGANGENAYSIVLTNEAQVIPTNSSRIPLSSATYYTDIIVYCGGTERTDYTIGNISSANGINVTKTSSKVSFEVSTSTTLTVDCGSFTIPIIIDGKTFNKTFSWSCSKQGLQGQDGASAKLVTVTGEQVFKYSENFTGTPTPSTIVLKATILNTTENGKWQYMDLDGVWKNYTNNNTVVTEKTIDILYNSKIFGTSDAKSMRLRYYISDSLYDEITLIKVSDGAKGTDGTNGTDGTDGIDAYTIILTNESQSIPTNNSRVPLSSSTYSTDIIVYQGITQRTDFTVGTISSANGITVNKPSSSKINFTVSTGTAISADSGSFTIPITIDSKTFNKVFSWSCSKQGISGVGISSVAEYYAISSSNTTVPTSWSTTVPTMTTTNKYLWNYETITYTNNTTKDTEKRVIGAYGDKGATGSTGATGATGNGISTITNYYLATSSSSGITTSTSGWTTDIQSVSSSKKYLWNYEIVTYTNGSTDTTTPCIIGAYGDTGATGADAYTIILTNENHTFPCDYDGNIASAITTTTQVLAFKGTKQVTPTIGTLPNVNGLSLSKNSTNSTITIVANSGSSLADNGTFTIPVVIDGITFNRIFSWSKSKAGLVGSNGEDGYTVLLTNENYTFIANSTGNIETTQTTTTNILLYKGAKSVAFTIGTLPTVSGLTLSSNGNVVTIQANTGTNLALNGTFDIIINADGKSFIKTFSWSKSLKGLDGADGADGLDGAGAKAIDIIASSQVFKSTDGGETYTPDTIKLSPILQNINFSKWQYSINGGSTWLNVVSGEHGFVLSGSGDTIESYGNIVVSQTSLSFKSGETQTFNVNLSSAPTKNQVVTISASGCSVDKTSLTFTPSNYNSTQKVTVGGSTVGNGTIVLSSPNVNSKTVNVTIMQGTTTTVYGNIVTSASSLSFTSGSSTTFSVKLDKAPTNSQVVNISSSGCNVNTSSLTFTSTNYNTYQTITVSGTSVGTGSITLSSLNVSAKTITVTINSSGGSSGGGGGDSGTSIETASQGFNPNGSLDGNTSFTHTETYIPFSGNAKATINFGKTGWTRYIFYDSSKNKIGYKDSTSAVSSVTMADLQSLSPNAVYVRISINQTTTITLTGGSGIGGDSGESTLTIETANQGFNTDGSLDGNTAFTHTETYIPFSGNTDKIIQFGTTGWTRAIFYDSNKNRIGIRYDSTSTVSSLSMSELQSKSTNAVYVRVSINQTTTITLVSSTASATTMSLNDIDAQPISFESDSGKDSNYAIIVGTELTISKFSDLFTDTVTSIVFKALTTDSNIYDTMTVVKLHDSTDVDVEGMINSAVNPLIEANEFLTTRMDNAFSDGVITSYEKINMKTDLKEIDAQYEDITKIVNLYNNSSINGIYNEYKTAYNNLHTILDPVLSNMNSDSTQSVSVAKDAFLQYGICYSHLRTALDTYVDNNFTNIQTKITTMSNSVDIAVTKSTSNEQQINTMSKHMSFSDNGWLELYADNNGQEGRFKTQITDTKMAFLDNNSEVAYMSNQKLYINQAEVVNEMKIGNIVITISDLGGLIFSWDE